MKKILIVLVLICPAYFLNAQSNMVISAYNWLKEGKLDEAKKCIDAATIHPKTSVEPKTWLYRGNVYLAIALSKDEKYKALDTNALQVAYDAYQKSIEIDKDFVQVTANPPKAELGLYIIGEQHYNMGVEYFNKKLWLPAMEEFEFTKKINNIFGIKDTLATFNAAFCAIQLKDNEKAIKYLKELVNYDYRNPAIYPMLATMYKDQGDTVKMLGTIKVGKSRFPNDLGIIITETNYYLGTGQIAKAQELLKVAVEKDPNNAILHYTIGNNYDKLSQDSSLSEADKSAMLLEAEKAYNKAIELKPDYFDAYYNMGALFFNWGVRIFEKADAIQDIELYEIEKAKYMEMWQKALPFLEKAHTLMPDDILTLYSLKQLYARLNMPEKLKDVNAKIEALKK